MMTLRHCFYFMLLPICIGIFNVLVNPLDQWNIPRLPGISDKITETRWDPFIKSYQIQHARYDTLILGSSRAAIALSPHHPAFPSHTVYNYGLSGGGIYLQYLALQQALTEQPIKHIIITPDFFGFNAHLKLNQPLLHEQADLEKLFVPETGIRALTQLSWSLGNTYSNTLGWRGTNSALRTLISQNQKTVYIDRQGYWNRFGTKDRNFALQFDRTERVFLTELLFPSPARRYAFNDANSGYDSFAIFRQLLLLAQQHQLQTTIIILPTPARDLLALQILEQWPHYLQWKKMLVEINTAVASDAQASPFPLWDFENINNDIESDNIRDLKPFFFEPFHPTPLVGDRILNRVFMDCAQVACWPGHPLNTENVSASLAELEQGLISYKRDHPQQLRSLMGNINKTSAYRHTEE